MADNTTLDPGTGGDTLRDKDRAGVKTPVVALDLNPAGSESLMAGVMPVNDNSGSLTVDAPVATPVATRLSDGASFLTSTSGRLAVDGSGVTQPVSGTVTANAGTGTLAVSAATLPLPSGASTSAKQPALGTAGTASTDVVTVQGISGGTVVPVSGTVTANAGTGTQAVSAASLPLPSGAATAAKQPALGTAGTASADVLTVQGAASMTAVKTDGSAVTQPVTAASLPLPSGAATAAKQPALGTAGTPATDVVTVQGAASMTAVKVDGSGVTQPVSLAGTQSVNQAQIAGTTTDTNSGVKSAGTQRVVIATDQPALTNALKVDPSAVTSPVSLASLPALATGSNLAGRMNLEPQTANGLSIFHLVSAASTNATNVKAGVGQVYGWFIYNSNAAARKVAFHNTAGTPTAGASVAFAIVIPPSSAANVEFTNGVAFATGIAITTVTDLTDAGTTAVAASDLIINIFFK